jgi:phosphoglycolate phosphatase
MANANFGRLRAFLFDLDGTLIDSKMDLVHAVNAMLRATHRPEQNTELVASYIGHGAPQLIASVLGPVSTEAERQEALAVFLAEYEKRMLELTRAYPGVEEGLRALEGFPMAVLTNKPLKMAVEILDGLRLAGFFDVVYGGDSFAKKKPDPEGALTIAKRFGVAPEEATVVGDSDVDVQTARNAGMWSVGVKYGFGVHDPQLFPADVYVDRLTELVPLAATRA